MEINIRKAEPRDVPDIQNLVGHMTGHDLAREAAGDRFGMIERSAIDELYVLKDEKGVQGP